MLKKNLRPGNFSFDSAYAAIEDSSRLPKVPVTDTKTVLKM